MGKVYKRLLDVGELDWLFQNGYAIRPKWIGPVERFDYYLYIIGGGMDRDGKYLGCHKCPRACYNQAGRVEGQK